MKICVFVFLSFCLCSLVYALAEVPVLSVPTLGYRGLQRKKALKQSTLFRLGDPLIRIVASWISTTLPDTLQKKIEELLRPYGKFLGLVPQEYLSLNLISIITSGAFGYVVSASCQAHSPVMFLALGLLIGGVLPFFQFRNEQMQNIKEIERQLPSTIDLAAMCMNAGLDFAGSIRTIVDNNSTRMGAIELEMFRILQELEVGHTRKQALRNFQKRVPSSAIADFVGAVVQADEKGSPLAETFQIQAQALRMRRSVAAEEAAARAGVLMMIPLFLLLCSIMLTIFGPFIIKGIGI